MYESARGEQTVVKRQSDKDYCVGGRNTYQALAAHTCSWVSGTAADVLHTALGVARPPAGVSANAAGVSEPALFIIAATALMHCKMDFRCANTTPISLRSDSVSHSELSISLPRVDIPHARNCSSY